MFLLMTFAYPDCAVFAIPGFVVKPDILYSSIAGLDPV